MRWLESFVDALRKIVPVAAFVLAYLSLTPEYLGLDVALMVFNGILVSVLAAMLYFFKFDLDNEFGDVISEIEQFRSEASAGFDGVVDGIEKREVGEEDVRKTDGGGSNFVSHEDFTQRNRNWNGRMGTEEYVDLGAREPSGAGALGGVVAGGLLGAPFGPAAVIFGGVVGGLVGNAVEYQNLKERRKEDLRKAAWNVIKTRAHPRPHRRQFVEQRDGEDGRGEYWEFEFVDERDETHYVRLYLNDEKFRYLDGCG